SDRDLTNEQDPARAPCRNPTARQCRARPILANREGQSCSNGRESDRIVQRLSPLRDNHRTILALVGESDQYTRGRIAPVQVSHQTSATTLTIERSALITASSARQCR